MIPAELKYDYMMYYIASKYCLAPWEAANCSENDFTLLTAFETIDTLTQKYYMEQNKNEQA